MVKRKSKMNSFMKAKKETNNISNNEIKPNLLEKEKVKEEHKTSPTFTFKDFQKSIKEKSSKTSTVSFPEELPKEVKLPLPIQNNINSSLNVEKINNEKINEELAFEEFKKSTDKKMYNNSEDITKSEVKAHNLNHNNDFSSIQVEYEKESCYDADTDIEDEDYETDKPKDYNKNIVNLDSNNYFIGYVKDNDKIIDIELVPYIFTEQFNNTKDCYDSSTFSKFLFIDSTTFNILNQETIKTVLNKLGQCLYEHKLVSLKGYPKLVFNGSYYTINCRIVIDDERFEDINNSNDSDIINKSYEKYMSKVQDFKIYADTDIYFYNFKYIKEYLNIYIRHIFGYSAHKINYSCDLQKEISDSLKHKSIDPFTYFRSTIPIKKYTVNYKDNEYTNIIKVGFVFNDDINKIESI